MGRKKSTFEFDEDTTKRLVDLQQPLSVSTRTGVIRRSLKIVETLVQTVESGGVLYIKTKDEGELQRVIII